MNPLVLKIIFTIGMVLWIIIRIPYRQEQQKNKIVDDRRTVQETVIRVLVLVGVLLLPLIYVLSPWLDFANYRAAIWSNGLGVFTLAIALCLFWRTHHDLGKNWSSTLQIREGHTLVTNGVYHSVRHPMYTSVLLLCIAQALLLPNWVAGPAGLLSFSIAYATRIEKEEQMLLDQFGDQYEAYRRRTKRLVPYLF